MFENDVEVLLAIFFRNSAQIRVLQNELSLLGCQLLSTSRLTDETYSFRNFFGLAAIEVFGPSDGPVTAELEGLPRGIQDGDVHETVLIGYDHGGSSYEQRTIFGDDVDHARNSDFD
jgi:uncharacterized membrane protein